MKRVFSILTISGIMFAVSCIAFLQVSQAVTVSKTFTVSANIPSATGLTITASRVASSTNAFTVVSGTALSFDPMTLTNGIYLPGHFFAIDVGTTGGAGSPAVTVTYTEGANPNNPRNGLGTKATATFIKVQGVTGNQTETGLVSHGPKKMLKNINSETITSAELTGGFLRIYVGIVTKDQGATFPDPAGSETFSNTDTPGNYDGTIFISATVA